MILGSCWNLFYAKMNFLWTSGLLLSGSQAFWFLCEALFARRFLTFKLYLGPLQIILKLCTFFFPELPVLAESIANYFS